ncbi:MAG: RNA-binding protein S4 [Candidatus Rokubacteria bacterium 13_1_20CM_4_70_14]|nr:MAG: RNA-binding protein S4 [Candidatus Rokubacteria bacterium 13_1_40CM_69_96]OLD75475.1 MAG: RNA-binding protein S4 [Candidatus Rokubacteria bacterium 13_1_20CM_4_70_14]PYM44746.1 MAG: RNA-binding protein S4 [Candidatus Rokubacteria bacterium]
MTDSPDSLRVDKWLWAARFFKTRSLAAAACAGGKVDVNDDTAKPAKPVRVGDRLRITQRGGKRLVKVQALAATRGPAPVARALYDDLTPAAAPRVRQAPPPWRERGSGRPTKRERRELQRLRGF